MLSVIEPDLESLRDNLLLRRPPKRVHYFEHGIAPNVQEALRVTLNICDTPVRDEATVAQWEREAHTFHRLGFELFRVWLPGAEFAVAGSKGTTWGEEHEGPIQSWQDLERYDWPNPAAIDYRQLEYYDKHLPPNMGVVHVTKVWEVVRELLGFEFFCIAMTDQPDLVAEVCRRGGAFHVALAEGLCDFRSVFAIYTADDYGYKTSTMMRPQIIRDLLLPWHRQIGTIAHEHGKLFFFHSCGKVDVLMDDLIDDLHIDAKHSFEDTVVPVTEAKRRWGSRVAILGGLDVDFIARADVPAIRQRVRDTLAVCQPGGGYCLGLGNWVTEYIPPDHYLAVLQEGRSFLGNGVGP